MRAQLFIPVVAAALVGAVAAGAWPGPPVSTSPHPKGANGPPAAWLETPARSLWLAFSSYCWKTTCADFLPPQSRTDLPVIRVAKGTTARIHLAFAPSELHVTTFAGTTLRHATLRPARLVRWRALRTGIVSFDVRATAGSASYLVRIRVD